MPSPNNLHAPAKRAPDHYTVTAPNGRRSSRTFWEYGFVDNAYLQSCNIAVSMRVGARPPHFRTIVRVYLKKPSTP